ncbi:MAG: LemA family protein [Planctomycetota bacterium]|nr:MAG: LemA family protein [Planctomycetota bacterium]
MPGVLIALAVLVGLGILVFFAFVSLYNGLVRGRNKVDASWAQIEVQLKRRHDLIPNLVETCKGYMKHEREVLENIARARSGLLSGNPAEAAQANAQLNAGLRSLMAVVENYPELKADENFHKLHEELTQTENAISHARQDYNAAVLQYNNQTQMIPSNIVAAMFNFKPREFFEVEAPEERKAVQVKF